jgi:hypothetical protein
LTTDTGTREQIWLGGGWGFGNYENVGRVKKKKPAPYV